MKFYREILRDKSYKIRFLGPVKLHRLSHPCIVLTYHETLQSVLNEYLLND